MSKFDGRFFGLHPKSILVDFGTIQVLRQQRGEWVGSENGNL